MANMEEMKCLEPMDKVLFSRMSELTGRNESKRSSSLEIVELWWLSPWIPGEGNTSVRKVTETPKMHQRGGSDDMLTRIWYATGETLLTPARNSRKQGKQYNRGRGKSVDGERESEGLIIAKKLGNAGGAKQPYCKTISFTKREVKTL